MLAVGGTRVGDDESEAVLAAEIFDPDTQQWTTVAAMAEARMYHSSTVLLPDGRVVAAGGEADGRLHAQIYSPPYLFLGPRPTITSAPSSAGFGGSFIIETPQATSIAKVSLIRPGASTHTHDHNQLLVPLSFTESGGQLQVTSPPDGNTAPPGLYMLIIEDTNGVPSVAEWIRVDAIANLSPGAITGQITDADTAIGIAGATVSYGGGSTTTNASGNYTLADVPTGAHVLTVSASGHANATRSVTVAAGSPTVEDFALVPPGEINGQVTSLTTGNPIDSATILHDGGTTTTDASGNYTIPSIASGVQEITASSLGFEGATQSVTVPPNGSVTADFVLDDAHTAIEGEVLDAVTGEPIEGAVVSFSGGSTTTDTAGFYLMDAVGGTYDVTASMPGYFDQTISASVIDGFETTVDFDLLPMPPPGSASIGLAGSAVSATVASGDTVTLPGVGSGC